jgi:Fic family protein
MKHYHPKQLNIKGKTPLDFNSFHQEYANATYALGLLEGSQKKLKNPELLVSPLTAKEAAVSSQIEGTVSTVSDVFIFEAGGKQNNTDTRQVANYRMAISQAMNDLKRGRPLGNALIESLHATLLNKVRHRGPLGRYREETVYIAKKPTDPIAKALYLPPEHYLVRDYIENIVNYLEHGEDDILIKVAMFHYQFEAVHPFSDGNGRLGRLLIPLILYDRGILSSPILYLSGYIDDNREQYRGWLHEVDETGSYEGWIEFFFRCVAAQAKETQELIDKIYQLHEETKSRFQATKSPYLAHFVDLLFYIPVFTTAQIKLELGSKSTLTVQRLITLFKESNIIEELSFRVGRSKVYAFRDLINLLK